MKHRNRLFIKTVINFALVFVGTLVLILLLNDMQHQVAQRQQYNTGMDTLEQIITTLERNETDAAELTRVYHNGNRQTLQDLSRLLTSGLFDDYFSTDNKTRSAQFRSLVQKAGVDYLFVMDKNSTILLAPNPAHTGLNLCDVSVLTSQQMAVLADGTDELVYADTDRGGYYFYSTPVSVGDAVYYLVLGQQSAVLQLQCDSLTNLTDTIGNVSIGKTGFVFAINNLDKTFLYFQHGSEVLTGKNAIDAGIPEKLLKDRAAGMMTIGGVQYYCVSRTFNGTTLISAAMTQEELYARNDRVVLWAAGIFIMVLVVTLIYTLILRRDLLRRRAPLELKHVFGTRLTVNQAVGQKILPITVAGLVFVFGVTYYAQTLLALSRALTLADSALKQTDVILAESKVSRKVIEDYYNEHYISKARLIAFLIEEDPYVLNTETTKVHTVYTQDGVKLPILDDEGNPLRSVNKSPQMQQMCRDNSLKNVTVFNEQGCAIATSSDRWYEVLSTDRSSASWPFREVLDGRLEQYIEAYDTESQNAGTQLAGVSFRYFTTLDENGNTRYVSSFDYDQYLAGTWPGKPVTAHNALLQVELDDELMGSLLYSTDMRALLDGSRLSDDGFLLAFDNSAEHHVLYSPVTADIGRTAAQAGISEKAFNNDYYSFEKVGDRPCFMSYHYEEGYYVAVGIPQETLYQARLPVALVTTLISLIMLIIMQGLFIFSTEEQEKLLLALAEEENVPPDRSHVTITMPTGERRRTISAISRWSRRRFTWDKKTPEQKLVTLLRGCAMLAMALLIVALIWREEFFPDSSVIHYILNGSWERSLHIFSLTRCVLIFLTISIFTSIVSYVIRMVTSIFEARTETIGHLLVSVIRYGGALAALFYSLYLIGFDPISLLTSAGILSIVVGLGSQSLISDIIAGIFIVFEGEFRVGDIVTIDDTRGTVIEIGIRTTKVADTLQNIRIYNNSTISSVLNMTKKASIATCTLSVAYGESIERVESVLAHEFPNIAKKLPAIQEGPFYKGVQTLNASSVDLLITAKCSEGDRIQLARDLNREMFIICGKYNINIPFPQVTVSYLDEEYEKEQVSKRVQQNAERFVHEQKEAEKLDAEGQQE